MKKRTLNLKASKPKALSLHVEIFEADVSQIPPITAFSRVVPHKSRGGMLMRNRHSTRRHLVRATLPVKASVKVSVKSRSSHDQKSPNASMKASCDVFEPSQSNPVKPIFFGGVKPWTLALGAWIFSGAWSLVLGISLSIWVLGYLGILESVILF